MNPMLQQFTAVALPILLGLAGAAWLQNKRFDDMGARFGDTNGRLDEIIKRLDRIEAKLENHTERIVKLEERTSPFARRS